MARKTRSFLVLTTIAGLAVAASCGSGEKRTKTPTGEPGAGAVDDMVERSALPDDTKWDLTPLFADDKAFESGMDLARAKRGEIAVCKGTLAAPASLRACMELYFETRLLTNKLTTYALMRQESDVKDAKLQGMVERSQAAMKALIAQASFFRKEILDLDDAALENAAKAEPKLNAYRPYIAEIRRRRNHTRGVEAEHILTLAGDNLWAEIDLNEIPSGYEKSFQSMMADMPMPQIRDEDGKMVQLTMSNYGKYRGSENRSVRKAAVESFFATLKQYEHVYAALMAGQAEYSLFLARSRGYDTVLDAYLHKDDIDPSIYKSLISSIEANLAPLHRYVALRKKLMGVKELHIYDLYTPMVPGVSKEVPYEEAMEVIPKALAPLGEEYIKVLRHGLDPKNGWVDVYPHKNKGGGAYCINVFGLHPWVLMNYYKELNDLSVLAHEYGHAMHAHLTMTTQPYVNAHSTPMISETASTFNEKLLMDYLIANAASNDEKLYLLNELVELIRGTIYRQTLFASFELAVHTAAEQGTAITAKYLHDTYAGLVRKYYGPDFTMGENDGYEWSYVRHFFYKYYVFSYAVGLSSGIALAEKVQNGDAAARDAYLGMLRAGASKPALDLLRDAGVDLATPAAFEAAARLMDRSLTEIEKLAAAK